MVDKFCHFNVIKNRIRQDNPFFWFGLSHFLKIFRFCLVVFIFCYFNVPAGTFTQPCYKASTNKKTAFNTYCKKCFKLTVAYKNYFFLTAVTCPGFGRFVPYLERLCLRPLTPDVSSVPRTMW